jgi:hypothetical protein
MPTVALGSDFLDAYARIPRAQQRKVREFTEKFKANPKSPGTVPGITVPARHPLLFRPGAGGRGPGSRVQEKG